MSDAPAWAPGLPAPGGSGVPLLTGRKLLVVGNSRTNNNATGANPPVAYGPSPAAESWPSIVERKTGLTLDARGWTGDMMQGAAGRIGAGFGNANLLHPGATGGNLGGIVAIESAINDVRAWAGDVSGQRSFVDGLRTLLAILNSERFVPWSDASITYKTPANWTALTFATIPRLVGASGTKYTQTVGEYFDVAVPSGYPEVTICGPSSNAGGPTLTCALNPAGANTPINPVGMGGSGGSVDMSNRLEAADPWGNTTVALRFTGLPAGANIIRISLASAPGSGQAHWISGYYLPAKLRTPVIAYCLEPDLTSAAYALYGSATPPANRGSSALLAAYNTLAAGVLAEFAGMNPNIFTVDLNAGFDPTTMHTATDSVHFNQAGVEKVAGTFIAWLNARVATWGSTPPGAITPV